MPAVLWTCFFLFVLLSPSPVLVAVSPFTAYLPGPARLPAWLARYVRRHGTSSSSRLSTAKARSAVLDSSILFRLFSGACAIMVPKAMC
ncbi:hypothetical protein GGR54DRAFT_330847 [Hypoxylon sp. NC1633]|nr:hypothetical protein GGR54DRAFT_330847 [Hypoxylon sp. NC1633]